jgi:hypothetical protein
MAMADLLLTPDVHQRASERSALTRGGIALYWSSKDGDGAVRQHRLDLVVRGNLHVCRDHVAHTGPFG